MTAHRILIRHAIEQGYEALVFCAEEGDCLCERTGDARRIIEHAESVECADLVFVRFGQPAFGVEIVLDDGRYEICDYSASIPGSVIQAA